MRVLITGVNGFAGPYTAEHILGHSSDAELWGFAWGDAGHEPLRPLLPRLRVVQCDITDLPSLESAVRAARPDVILHLAAASSVVGSWDNPAQVFGVNAIGQVNLFEVLRSSDMKPLVVVASSAEIYGRVEEHELPIREGAALRPVTPYGVSKAAQDLHAYQAFVAAGLPTVRLRLFNHTGPRRPPCFFASSFAHQIAQIETGRREPVIHVGNLDVIRDLSDVRDVARAYWLAALRGRPGAAYNVCTGKPVSVRAVLGKLLELTDHRVEVVEDRRLLRAADIPLQYGDCSEMTAATGWRPEIPLDQTLADLLAWWRLNV